ncbi:cold-shock protein [Bradyrhizobium sp. JR3.5]
MAWGEIARWNSERGFGFVKSDFPKSEDVFVYGAVLRRAGIEPRIGTCLEFETEIHKGRPRVKSCKPLRTWRDAETTDED